MSEAEMPPVGPGAMPRRVATEAEASAMASSIRLRILRMTYLRPMTNRQIAQRLHKDPATTLYHVRKLVDVGLMEAMPVRRGTRGAREIPYRSTGLTWTLDVGPTEGVALDKAMLEAFLGEVADVGVEQLQQTRLVLRLDDEQLEEFRARIYELLSEFAARPPVPEAVGQAVYLVLHPASDPAPDPVSGPAPPGNHVRGMSP